MKIRVSKRIEMGGKVVETSAETEAPDTEYFTSHAPEAPQAVALVARNLFESMEAERYVTSDLEGQVTAPHIGVTPSAFFEETVATPNVRISNDAP